MAYLPLIEELDDLLAEVEQDIVDATEDLEDAEEYRAYQQRDLDRRVHRAQRRLSALIKRKATLTDQHDVTD
jgi:hypothetical protein